MKSNIKLVLLFLVMMASLYGLNAFTNGEGYVKVRTSPITGLQTAETGELCQTSTGEAICVLNNKNYGRKLGTCRLYCRADKIHSSRVPSGGSATQPGASSSDVSRANLAVRLVDPPSMMFKGEEYRINVKISNYGDGSTSENERDERGFWVFLKLLDGSREMEIGEEFVGRLSAGDSVRKTFIWNPPESFSEGDYEYHAEVDVRDNVIETNEGDNVDDNDEVSIESRTVRDGPDLTIDIIKVTDEGGNTVTELVTSRKYYVHTVIRNEGNENIPSFTGFRASISHSKGSISGSGPHSWFGYSEISKLNRENELLWTDYWTVPDSFQEGDYDLVASVDTQRKINESDEQNRVLKRISIRKATSSEVVVSSASALPGNGNRWKVEAVFKNEGETAKEVRGFIKIKARILKGSRVVCEDDHSIDGDIESGESVNRLLQFEYRGGCFLDGGQHVLEIYLEGKQLYRRAFDSGGGSLQCPSVDGRIVLGHRTEGGLYCHKSGVLKAQETNGKPCVNSYECRSNLCLSGKCVGGCTYGRGDDESTVPAGVRIGGSRYCSADNRVHYLESDGSRCEEHYQCSSGVCFDRVCISESVIKNALCRSGNQKFCV